MQLLLGRAHEELKERNQAPSVAREQLVSETFFHLLDILDTSNQAVILVQQHITLSIQLRHHLRLMRLDSILSLERPSRQQVCV